MFDARARIVATEARSFLAKTDDGKDVRLLVTACPDLLLVGTHVVLGSIRERPDGLWAYRAAIDEAHREDYARLLERHTEALVATLTGPSVALERENGAIVAARIAAEAPVAERLEALLALPGARLTSLAIDRFDLAALRVLDRARPARLASVRIGSDPNARLDRYAWQFAVRWPRLEDLELVGRIDDLVGPIPSRLRRLVIRSSQLSRRAVAKIANASWPALEELVLWIGPSDVTTPDLARIVDGAAAPALVALGICNTTRTNDVCRRLAKSSLARRLRRLDLSLGTMTDGGAAAIGAAAFPKLESLDARQNLLGPLGEAYLRRALPSARTGDQRGGYGEGRRVPALVNEERA